MAPAHRQLRVLLVEDDARVRALIGTVLAACAAIDVAVDPAQADAVVDRAGHAVELAIAAYLPAGRGAALLARIQRRCPGASLIAITQTSALAVEARRHGATEVLCKPFNADDVRRTVASLCPRVSRRLGVRPYSHVAVARVLRFLGEHVDQPVSLAGLAQIAAISPSHLSRTFRADVGVPLRAYVRDLRLERARQLLLSPEPPSLTAVAIEMGFYDLPHFDKAFRERYGVTPSEFLRNKGPAPPVKLRARRRPA